MCYDKQKCELNEELTGICEMIFNKLFEFMQFYSYLLSKLPSAVSSNDNMKWDSLVTKFDTYVSKLANLSSIKWWIHQSIPKTMVN